MNISEVTPGTYCSVLIIRDKTLVDQSLSVQDLDSRKGLSSQVDQPAAPLLPGPGLAPTPLGSSPHAAHRYTGGTGLCSTAHLSTERQTDLNLPGSPADGVTRPLPRSPADRAAGPVHGPQSAQASKHRRPDVVTRGSSARGRGVLRSKMRSRQDSHTHQRPASTCTKMGHDPRPSRRACAFGMGKNAPRPDATKGAAAGGGSGLYHTGGGAGCTVGGGPDLHSPPLLTGLYRELARDLPLPSQVDPSGAVLNQEGVFRVHPELAGVPGPPGSATPLNSPPAGTTLRRTLGDPTEPPESSAAKVRGRPPFPGGDIGPTQPAPLQRPAQGHGTSLRCSFASCPCQPCSHHANPALRIRICEPERITTPAGTVGGFRISTRSRLRGSPVCRV